MKDKSPPDQNPGQVTTLSDLTQMKGSQLATLYQQASAGEVPDGDSHGKAIILAGTWIGWLLSSLANRIWTGKVFDRENRRLVNKVFGMHLIHADVFPAPSWCDGNDATIIDYWKSSLVAFYIRDEIRLVEPGLYLGRAYIRLPFGMHFCALLFALYFRSADPSPR